MITLGRILSNKNKNFVLINSKWLNVGGKQSRQQQQNEQEQQEEEQKQQQQPLFGKQEQEDKQGKEREREREKEKGEERHLLCELGCESPDIGSDPCTLDMIDYTHPYT